MSLVLSPTIVLICMCVYLGPRLRLPLLINMAEEAGDSDIDSSQQSNASDEPQSEDTSSQVYCTITANRLNHRTFNYRIA